ncbi:hypothetical protein [Planctomicrobium piriforme]|uniref:Uncharacterized protein n=1 Tax=Planctomicrobium piriforme TaxID=1576369 RepID=A0A1I3N7L9_9PLAN|nr:hypothetical protein [Planctomicrobium piriforme]SFJ05050.1 hypothetical protein SAMN05421753_11512 [Planctomicrobium piriforme]
MPLSTPLSNTSGKMEFEDRLRRAIERGEKTRDARGRDEMARELSLEELRTLHSQYRFEVTEHIENCLKKLSDHLPGFKYQSVMNEEGWGGRISRDDLHLVPKKAAESRYSRLEVVITPFSPSGILEMTVKGTVRNREVLNRKHYQKLTEFDRDAFLELVDLRVLEFAELYTATQ